MASNWKLIASKYVISYSLCQCCRELAYQTKDETIVDANDGGVDISLHLCKYCKERNLKAAYALDTRIPLTGKTPYGFNSAKKTFNKFTSTSDDQSLRMPPPMATSTPNNKRAAYPPSITNAPNKKRRFVVVDDEFPDDECFDQVSPVYQESCSSNMENKYPKTSLLHDIQQHLQQQQRKHKSF